MWPRRLILVLAALAALPLRAEPRIPGMDTQLEAELARGNYMFVWDIDRRTIGRGDPYRTLRTYYDGLMYALTEARRLIEPGTPARLKLDPMPLVKDWEEAYAGTLSSHETYLEGAPVTLHAEVTRRDCDRNRSQVFFAVSLKPRDDPEWTAMRKARDGIRC
jgi:hypothetical protein